MPNCIDLSARALVHHGDCLDVLARMDADSVDAVVTDPPYGLEFMGKDWDAPWQASSKSALFGNRERETPSWGVTRNPTCRRCSGRLRGAKRCKCESPDWDEAVRATYLRQMAGFQDWCEQWASELLRVLKPGGHMLVFGGTRTYHRMACAVEDAGFEVRDCIMWLYGEGMPKSHNVSKALDREADYPLQAEVRRASVAAVEAAGLRLPGNSRHDWTIGEHAPGDKWWARFRDWLPTLSDLDRERVEGEIVSRICKTAGWFTSRDIYDVRAPATDAARDWQGWGTALKPAHEPIMLVRKPLSEPTIAANVLRWGCGALNIDASRVESPDCDSTRVHRQSSNRKTWEGGKNSGFAADHVQPTYDAAGRWPANVAHDGSAEVSDLFAQFGEKASGRPGVMRKGKNDGACYGAESRPPGTPMTGFGDSGSAGRFFYCAKASSVDRAGSKHPTVKPLMLMRHLCMLVTPPGGTILDPFAGSGTTLQAAVECGFRAIGIERAAEYHADILRRLAAPPAKKRAAPARRRPTPDLLEGKSP